MKAILFLMALLFAAPVLAADGDACDSGRTMTKCKMLCDSDTGDVSCADLPIEKANGGDITVEIHNQTGCTACSVDINWTAESGGQEHDVATLTCTGTTAHTISSDVRVPGWLTATISGTAGPCTDLDVFAHFE